MRLFSKVYSTTLFGLMIPLCQLLAGITGKYDVKGNNPDGTSYKGVLEISRDDEVYSASWKLSDGISKGNGVTKDGYLAISFEGFDGEGGAIVGTQLYKIHKNTLKGPWTFNGTGTQGNETAKKRHKS